MNPDDRGIGVTGGPAREHKTWHPRVQTFNEAAESVAVRAKKLASTSAQGLPKQYASSFEWAGAWVKEHGVTLPPDTPELRSLRNWFCYKMSQYKKGTLGANNTALLAKHGIDLSLYDAPNTGKGKRLPDQILVEKLRRWREVNGSYDLTAAADDDLLLWQRRILSGFEFRGRSARMAEIEAQLEGLDIAVWRRPDGRGEPTDEAWWAMARRWRQQNEATPAYRGTLDPRTPEDLSNWAAAQARAARKLSSRQVGELRSLGLLPDRERARLKVREAATTLVKHVERVAEDGYGHRERSLNTFFGVCMYLRLITQGTPLTDIYASLAITPHSHQRLLSALNPLMGDIERHCRKDVLFLVRMAARAKPIVAQMPRIYPGHSEPPGILKDLIREAMEMNQDPESTGEGRRVAVGKAKLSNIWNLLVTVDRARALIEPLQIMQDIPERKHMMAAKQALLSASTLPAPDGSAILSS